MKEGKSNNNSDTNFFLTNDSIDNIQIEIGRSTHKNKSKEDKKNLANENPKDIQNVYEKKNNEKNKSKNSKQ